MNPLLEKNSDFIILKFGKRMETVSSAFFNGGYGYRDGVFIIKVPANFNENPILVSKNFSIQKKLKNYSGFMTAVDLEKNAFYLDDEEFSIILTLGLGYNCLPGKECKKSKTINTILIVKETIEFHGAMDLLNVMISTKVYSLMRRNYGVGTSSDAFLIAFNRGNKIKYGGFSTKIGRSLSNKFLNIMEMAIDQWEKVNQE